MKENCTRLAIAVTGTIDPGNTPSVAVVDPSMRATEYAENLRRWSKVAKRLDAELFFIENSGSSLIEGVAPTGVHVKQYQGNVVSEQRGKGAGEADLLMRATTWIEEEVKPNLIVKCSGRQFPLRAEAQLRRLDHDARIIARLPRDFDRAETRLFAGQPAALQRLAQNLLETVDEREGRLFETEFTRHVLQLIIGGVRVSHWPEPILMQGASGSTGLRYGRLHRRLGWFAAVALHRLSESRRRWI